MATPPLGHIPVSLPASETVPSGGTGNVQWYSFVLTEAAVINISAANNDPEVGLYDGSGNLVGNGGPSYSSEPTALAAGTYYVAIGQWPMTFDPDCEASSSTSNPGGDLLEISTPVPPEVLEWYAQGIGSINPMDPQGTDPSSWPATIRYGRVTDPGPGAIVWSSSWDQTGGFPGTPVITYPDGPDPDDVGAGDVDWPQGVGVDVFSLSGDGVGELRLFCEVGGVPVPGYLWIAYTMNAGPYTDASWGYEGPEEASAFWTGFRGTFEVIG